MDPLLRDAMAGSAAAADELAHRYRPLVETYLARRVGARIRRHYEVDDLVQDVFEKVLRSLRSLPDDATLETFAGRLLRNAQWVVARAARRAEPLAGESAAPTGGDAPDSNPAREAQGPVTLRDELHRVHRLAGRLDERSRRVLLGRMEGRTFEELAAESGELLDTVRKRYLRALHEARARLQARDPEAMR